ncbi:hypothetical protein CJI50_05615 [Bifidobacteriaceae bacterium NR021]|nr:hypothetical protein CJI50_05615 [Bifidobacteriaceae bacterium NR021]
MFGQNNQPKILARISLEQFEDVLSYIDYENIDHDTITLIGVSKGAEYALMAIKAMIRRLKVIVIR